MMHRTVILPLGLALLFCVGAAPSLLLGQDAAGPGAAEPAPREVLLAAVPVPPLDELDAAVREVIESRTRQVQEGLTVESPDLVQLTEAFGELGFLYHAHGLLDSAQACYVNARRLSPEDPRWSYAMALVLREKGDLEGAAQAYELNLEQLRRNTTALVGLAEVRLEQNMPLVARAHLWHALELSAESPAALAGLGQVALSTKDYARAVNYFERALDQVPEANRLHYPLALAYRGLGETEKAREHLARRGEVGIRAADPIFDAIQERKTGERVMILEGRRAFAVERYEEAAESFRKALVSNPESVAARVNLATALGAAGKIEEAMGEYRAVLEKDPANAAAAFNLGALLQQQGRVEEAVPLLRRAAEADPRDAESRAQLAAAYEREGKLEEAFAMVEEARDIDRSDQEVWLAGRRLLSRLGRHAEARAWLEEARQEMPDQGLILHALAELLATSPDLEQRDGEKAVTLATQVASAGGKPAHWLTLSKALAEAGRCEDAASVIRQLLEQAPEEAQEPLQAYLETYENGPPCRL